MGKILQANSLLGLDVIAYDSNYNRLDPSEATTMFLFDELKKNNNFQIQIVQPVMNQPQISYEELNNSVK